MPSVAEFECSLSGALQNAAKVLERTRYPKLAGDVPHEYRDKFQVVESVVRASCAAFVGCLERLGVDDAVLRRLVEAGARSEVTLESRSRETCTFLRRTRTAADVVTCTDMVRETVLRRVHEVDVYHWRVEAEWQLCAVTGTARADALVVRSVTFAGDVTTTLDRSPFAEHVERDPVELSLTWLLRVLSRSPTELDGVFVIDRAAAACRTPRRNPDTEAAVCFLRAAAAWGGALTAYADRLFAIDEHANEDLDVCAAANVFMPALPLMEEAASSSAAIGAAAPDGAAPGRSGRCGSSRSGSEAWTGGALSAGDTKRFVDESVRQLDETLALVSAWPAAGLVSAASGRLAVAAAYIARLARAGTEAVGYVEDLLRRQLVAALGQEVTSADFDAYMRHHTRRLFDAAHGPLPLCVPVRAAPGRHPEGAVSVESGGEVVEPAASLLVDACACTRFALNTSAEVSVRGRTHVHAHVLHRFCPEEKANLVLHARARQFGGFIVLLGVVAEKGLFLPKHAMIVQNKDEYTIPLDVAEIPTQAEFRDAIASLSPEQQLFAKAYRGMQLEATLFGVCVVQIKPQLERVLNLPRDALVKELELTQHLLELFAEYNISPDLLAYQPPHEAAAVAAADQAPDATPLRARVAEVRERVRAVAEMVADAKQEALAEAAAAAAVEAQKIEEDKRAKKEREREGCVRLLEYELDHQEREHKEMSSCVGVLSCCTKACAAPPSAGRRGKRSTGANRKKAEEMYDDPTWSCWTCGIDVDGLAPPQPPDAETNTRARHNADETRVVSPAAAEGLGSDVCRLPALMERALSSPVADGACMRPTVVTAGNSWTKTTQASLVSAPKASVLGHSEQKGEQQKAFDLLDALTRSGLLAIDDADMHVLSVASHCFEQTLIDTLVQGNVNPIEKVEVSLLLAAAAVYGVDADALLAADQKKRVGAHTPLLLADAVAV